MLNTNLIACSKCKGRVPLNDLRADKTGKGWVCVSCYSMQHPSLNTNKNVQQQNIQNNTIEIQRKQPQTSAIVKEKSIMSEILKKFNYQCGVCKYKFSRNFEYKGVCPFCGKLNTLENLNMDLEI